MGLFLQITGRAIPTIVLAGAGYFGYQYMQEEPDHRTSDSKKVEKKGSKSGSKDKGSSGLSSSKKSRGLTTKFLKFSPEDYQIQLKTQGIVEATQTSSITSQIAGKITQLNSMFANGSFVKEADVLAEIDRTDYEVAKISADAQLAKAKASYSQEKARGEQALRNWKEIGFDEEPNELVLRKPQLRETEANVKLAVAALSMADRDLTRCQIKPPFSGIIRNRLVGVGTYISGTTELGEILGTDFAEVKLPLSQVQLAELNSSEDSQPEVTFYNALENGNVQQWKGKIVRREGEMDLESRELSLIARIDDPFSLKNTHKTPLTFNQPVIALIPSTILKGVYVIDREHVIGTSDIITIQDSKVARITLEPSWEDEEKIVITVDQIPAGAVLATSRLEYASDGEKVTLIDNEGEPFILGSKAEESNSSVSVQKEQPKGRKNL